MRAIRIMVVLRPVSGGIRRHVVNLLEHLDRGRFDPIIVGPEGCLGEPEESTRSGFPFISLDIRSDPNPRIDLSHSLAIARLAMEHRIDIIHAHGYKAGLLSIWAGVRLLGRTAVLCTFHNPLQKKAAGPKAFALKKCAAWAGRCAERVITVSHALKSEAVHILGIPENKISCVYNGIDPAPFIRSEHADELRRVWKAGAETVVIGASARLIEQKGIRYLIQSAPQLLESHRDILFVVAGDGPERDRLEAEAQSLGVRERFVFAGYRTDMPAVLGAMDIFVQPSLEEGFSIAALEAMAAGRPVVASAVDGLPEVVSEANGILVPPGDVPALTRAIGELVIDGERRRQLGSAGMDRVKSEFDLKRMIDQHDAIYEGLRKNHAWK